MNTIQNEFRKEKQPVVRLECQFLRCGAKNAIRDFRQSNKPRGASYGEG